MNLSVSKAEDAELPDDEGAGASKMDGALPLFCMLFGRDDDELLASDGEVSSLRSDGNLDDVDILDGLRDCGWSSVVELEELDLLPSKNGVMKDPLAIDEEEKRKTSEALRASLAGVQTTRGQGRRRADDAGNLHKVRRRCVHQIRVRLPNNLPAGGRAAHGLSAGHGNHHRARRGTLSRHCLRCRLVTCIPHCRLRVQSVSLV